MERPQRQKVDLQGQRLQHRALIAAIAANASHERGQLPLSRATALTTKDWESTKCGRLR